MAHRVRNSGWEAGKREQLAVDLRGQAVKVIRIPHRSIGNAIIDGLFEQRILRAIERGEILDAHPPFAIIPLQFWRLGLLSHRVGEQQLVKLRNDSKRKCAPRA
jgi:hypothetical protein